MVDVDYVKSYLEYFFNEIVGFEKNDSKYMELKENEYLSIAMDKIDRLTRKNGRLRSRVWSNFYFIFHEGDLDPKSEYEQKVKEIKNKYPFLFIRSYVYFVFVDLSSNYQRDIFSQSKALPKKRDFKIWLFNSKYEVKEETRRSNLLGITLSKDEIVDDYIYLANPELELNRMESSNSDAVDCVKAFTGDLALLQQTSDMLEKVREDYREEQSRVIVEGPARSGKTIIAASLLGEFKNAKFLLMNYFFYQAIVDGFHALSGWDEEEINKLVKNDELDLWLYLEKTIPHKLNAIKGNLEYAIKYYGKEKNDNPTKKWLIENIDELAEVCESVDFDTRDLKVFNSLKNLNKKLKEQGNNGSFSNISFDALKKLHGFICGITSNNSSTLITITENISKVIRNLIENSEQKFFHHNINSKISSKVIEGCWIVRGNPTKAKLWTDDHKPELIICDEVQRLGVIGKYGNYDEFDETAAIIDNSKHTFFTGDNFQMLNKKYDKGIEKIEECLHGKGERLKKA